MYSGSQRDAKVCLKEGAICEFSYLSIFGRTRTSLDFQNKHYTQNKFLS